MDITRLCPELLYLIISNLDANSVRYISLVSSKFNQLFTAYKISILSTILQREIPSCALSSIIAVLSGPRKYPERPETLQAFLDGYFTGSGPDLPGDASTLVRLLRRHLVIKQSIDEYFDWVTGWLYISNVQIGYRKWFRILNADDFQRDAKKPHTPISKTEHGRIYRAFVRIELFMLCFEDHEQYNDNSWVHFTKQAPNFTLRLQPWEMEEMVCVHVYYCYRTTTAIDEIQRELISMASAPEPYERTNSNEPLRTLDADFDTGGLLSSYNWGRSDIFYRGVSVFVSKGIDYMQLFIHSQGKTHRDMFMKRIRTRFLLQRSEFSSERIAYDKRVISPGNHQCF